MICGQCETAPSWPTRLPELIVADARAWRRWLAANHDDGAGRLAGAGEEGHDAADDAVLRAGAGRGAVPRLDRRPGAPPRRAHVPPALHAAASAQQWSARNVAHVERLRGEGRMHAAGERAVAAAQADGRWDAAYAGPAHDRGARRPRGGAGGAAARAADVRAAHQPEPLRGAAAHRRRQAQRHARAAHRDSSWRCSRAARRCTRRSASCPTERSGGAPRRRARRSHAAPASVRPIHTCGMPASSKGSDSTLKPACS